MSMLYQTCVHDTTQKFHLLYSMTTPGDFKGRETETPEQMPSLHLCCLSNYAFNLDFGKVRHSESINLINNTLVPTSTTSYSHQNDITYTKVLQADTARFPLGFFKISFVRPVSKDLSIYNQPAYYDFKQRSCKAVIHSSTHDQRRMHP
jgi:hypothetical protein